MNTRCFAADAAAARRAAGKRRRRIDAAWQHGKPDNYPDIMPTTTPARPYEPLFLNFGCCMAAIRPLKQPPEILVSGYYVAAARQLR
ncbi:MAG TPA: hypothetical protein VFY24_14795 [Azospira sp.]|nr:hypothetical protein [Azospira sp.]